MQRNLTPTEGREFLARGLDYLSPFMVGFFKIRTHDGAQDGDVAGSGTLVQANGQYGILTADHVITHLPRSGDVGLVLADGLQIRLQRKMLNMDHVECVRIGHASNTELGPDLGLIRLPASVAHRLQVHNAFYDLGKRCETALSADIPFSDGGWVVSGLIHEWTVKLPDERGMSVKGLKGFVGAGVVGSERALHGFDYMDFETRFGPNYEGPCSFQGISGGGLWQLVAGEREGQIVVKEAKLLGVVFYEKAVFGGKDLICHGRRSVYDAALRELRRV